MACFLSLTSKGRWRREWDIAQHGKMGWSGEPLVGRSSVKKKEKHCELPRGGNLLHRANRECKQTHWESQQQHHHHHHYHLHHHHHYRSTSAYLIPAGFTVDSDIQACSDLLPIYLYFLTVPAVFQYSLVRKRHFTSCLLRHTSHIHPSLPPSS